MVGTASRRRGDGAQQIGREQRTKQKYAKAAADGLIGMSIEGASAELGGGGLRMNAKVVETPATAEDAMVTSS